MSDERAPREARRWVSQVLQLVGEAAEDVELLTSELVSNCVLHAGLGEGQHITVRAGRHVGGVRVEVCDEGGRFAKASASGPRAGGGRGLQILAAVSSDWGVHHDGITKVWFTYMP